MLILKIFFKNYKNIDMYFDTKSYLKNNRNHTTKQALNLSMLCRHEKITKKEHISFHEGLTRRIIWLLNISLIKVKVEFKAILCAEESSI